jgi:hypothetical protein
VESQSIEKYNTTTRKDFTAAKRATPTLLELALEDHRNIPIKIWEHKSNIKMW